MPEASRIIEFGCGMFSTPFFCERGRYVFSIEMQDPLWLRKVQDHLCEIEVQQHTGVDAIGPWEFLKVPGITANGPFDVGFVDGHGKTRWACVNLLMLLNVPLIIAHDTEAQRYGWHRVREHGYRRTDYKDLTPWTTVWEKVA